MLLVPDLRGTPPGLDRGCYELGTGNIAHDGARHRARRNDGGEGSRGGSECDKSEGATANRAHGVPSGPSGANALRTCWIGPARPELSRTLQRLLSSAGVARQGRPDAPAIVRLIAKSFAGGQSPAVVSVSWVGLSVSPDARVEGPRAAHMDRSRTVTACNEPLDQTTGSAENRSWALWWVRDRNSLGDLAIAIG